MSNRTKICLLAILMVTWVAILALRFTSHEEPPSVPLTFKSGQRLAKESVGKPVSVPTVAKLPTLREADISFATPKNIFAPLEDEMIASGESKPRPRIAKVKGPAAAAPASAAVPPPPPPPPMPSPQELAAQRASQQREQAAQLARQAMGQYRFIGFLTQNGEPRAFLGKGRELYIVRAGETVEGQIQVGVIEPSSLKLRDPVSNVETALPLVRDSKTVGF